MSKPKLINLVATVSTFCWEDYRAFLKEDLILQVEERPEGGFEICHQDLTIQIYGATIQNTADALKEYLAVLWSEYAEARDEDLSPPAIELKRRIWSLVKEPIDASFGQCSPSDFKQPLGHYAKLVDPNAERLEAKVQSNPALVALKVMLAESVVERDQALENSARSRKTSSSLGIAFYDNEVERLTKTCSKLTAIVLQLEKELRT